MSVIKRDLFIWCVYFAQKQISNFSRTINSLFHEKEFLFHVKINGHVQIAKTFKYTKDFDLIVKHGDFLEGWLLLNNELGI